MNKKMIRNTLLLLLIPLLISLIISIVSLKRNSFSTSVSYDNNNTITYQDDTTEISRGENIVNNYNRSYPVMIFSAFTLIIIFGIFYIYLTKKKGW